ncbi:helix-hairpin-helix domain-containing protein [Caballeronia sp. LZ016]|uniref:ComEA family DNA-binding protein n=1 Tax=Caballeronia sp. LZ016 TaxID=3038554 RepID=UPI00285AB05B|nr:helix-hairpin-helix domain-containing protein [Caballeronia sp. LZ016]MDR5738213.1 helix-hairpin-helix domain-containing protein [Caballeronia sp. LZ016]
MLKKLLMLCIAFMLSIGAAFATVDVNTADEAALESVKGLGPVKSKAIIDERTKNGPYKDADDLANRVKGLGAKSVAKLEERGLTIGGSSLPPTGKPSKPAPTASQGGAAPNSTVRSSTAATAATSPAATNERTPALTPASGASAASGKKKSSAATAGASAPAATSDAKTSRSQRKKDKAASDAAASSL